MQGRVHYYEGYSMQQVWMPARPDAAFGSGDIISYECFGRNLTGFLCRRRWMLITGILQVLIPSPLIGPNIDHLGPRFPDMTEVYDKELRKISRTRRSGRTSN
jgi:purine-nucleoside phosphorylase